MLDFTALPTRNKFYAGANGAKIAVIYDGEQYMLKFPAPAPKNKELSYANSCISEYIGCHIFNSVGIAAQETLLGIYRKNGCCLQGFHFTRNRAAGLRISEKYGDQFRTQRLWYRTV